MWPLLWWGMFPLYPLWCIPNVVYHIDWSANTEPSLYPWNKSYLVMRHYLFNTLQDSVYLYLFRTFVFILISEFGLFSYFVVSLSCFLSHGYKLIGWNRSCSSLFSEEVYKFIYLFIFGCVGSSFLCESFLQLRQAGATLHHGEEV